MLLSFADALRRDGGGSSGCIKNAGRITDCCREKTADAYGKERAVSPVEAVHVSVSEESLFYFEHINVWGCSYYIQAQKATITRLYYRDSSGYCRAIGLSPYRPFYGVAPDDLSKELGDPFWGYPGVLYKKNGWLRHRLMYKERLFTNKAEMDADIAAPAETDYQGFLTMCLEMDERLEFFTDGEEAAGEQEQKTDACNQAGKGSIRQAGRKP